MTAPTLADDWYLAPGTRASRALFNAIFFEAATNIKALLAREADYQAAIDQLVNTGSEIISQSLTPEIEAARTEIENIQAEATAIGESAAAAAEAAVDAAIAAILDQAIAAAIVSLGPVAWVSGETTPANAYRAHDNSVWRALVETTQEPGGADWEFLYSGPSATHNHDDRYYTKAQLGALDPVVLAGIPAVSDLVPIEGVTPTGYSRATTTSRTDPAGNAQSVPAGVIPVDYDATTGELIGWLFDDADDTWSVPLEATFDEAEGTIYIRGRSGSSSVAVHGLWSISDGTADNYLAILWQSDVVHFAVKAGGASKLNANLGALAVNTDFELAITWDGTAVKASLNGATFTSHTATSFPAGLTTEWRGQLDSAITASHWAGHVAQFARFARGVEGSTLQAMTGGLS
ncbi:hypothetical protein L0F51_03870 [Afifella sp. H1R]|uniref:hypothetical protein n=1 Tax=Afifella sp. H1R TaxID=2908841 RepID=UPI001F1F58A3|nr:hypothetical protein [Afifella sp. H1R]MCF1502903.1 hypothetical protein [Afifella sp. H1R]